MPNLIFSATHPLPHSPFARRHGHFLISIDGDSHHVTTCDPFPEIRGEGTDGPVADINADAPPSNARDHRRKGVGQGP